MIQQKFLRKISGFLWSLALVVLIMPAVPAQANTIKTLTRTDDPVILSGNSVQKFYGINPNALVGFKFENNVWVQIPVQVDERDYVELAKTLNRASDPASVVLTYTDPATFTGPDSNLLFDDNDELVFLSKDSGDKPSDFSEPTGILPSSGLEITVTDPLDGTAGYVYIFQTDGSLTQSANQSYVNYTFNLLSGDYRQTYNTSSGPNPENSVLQTPYYSQHFSDRWITDELRVSTTNASNVDILDRIRMQFSPDNCMRSEDTAAAGTGAFVVNKSGPVRAIRSYVGSNSGDYTQRLQVFYEKRDDMTTFLRVHPIAGSGSFVDYSPAASGMTYFNANNTTGLTIDGTPEGSIQNDLPVAPNPGFSEWEMVSGQQGSVSYHYNFNTDVPYLQQWLRGYYLDDSTPAFTQCTGDSASYGASGIWIDPRPDMIPCTDPRPDKCSGLQKYNLTQTKTSYYGPANEQSSIAVRNNTWVKNPLLTQTNTWVNPSIDTTLPIVNVTNPQNNSTISNSISLSATATDESGINSVQFLVNGVAVGSPDTVSPYSYTWDTTTFPNGTATIQARATDSYGNQATSQPVTATIANAIDLALNKPVTASSVETGYPASNVTDGNPTSMWRSKRGSKLTTEWITVDLGSAQTVSKVNLDWASQYARSYSVQYSTNNSTWTTAVTVTNGNGAIDTLQFNPVTARYIRLNTTAWLTTRDRNWLNTFEIYQ